MHEKEDATEWCVRVLKRPPIDLQSISDADLEDELEDRLEALLLLYQCGGWKDLAIKLALKYERALKIITPVDRKPRQGGREPGNETLSYLWALNQERKKCKTDAEAAKLVHKKLKGRTHAPSLRRLQNILSEAKSGRYRSYPRWMRRLPFENRIDAAIAKAVEESQPSGAPCQSRAGRREGPENGLGSPYKEGERQGAELQAAGVTSLRGIAAALNARDIPAARAVQVARVLGRV
jgi:hypothetical protein